MEMICICGVNPRTRYKFNTKSQKSVIEELNQLASGQMYGHIQKGELKIKSIDITRIVMDIMFLKR